MSTITPTWRRTTLSHFHTAPAAQFAQRCTLFSSFERTRCVCHVRSALDTYSLLFHIATRQFAVFLRTSCKLSAPIRVVMQLSSAPKGLILLDDDQQRTLRQGWAYSATPPHFSREHQPPAIAFNASTANESRANISARLQEPRISSSSSPRTNFTSNRGCKFTRESGDDETMLSAGGSSSERGDLNEYTTARASNPFITIMERDSQDAVEAFKGTRPAVNVSMPYIVVGAVVGIALGILLSYLKVSTVVADWISLPGTLFLRAIKSLVVPYVFCSVAVAIGDIVFVGKASAVGIQTFKVFFTEAATASLSGLLIALLFRPLFRHQIYEVNTEAAMGLVCGNGLSLEMKSNGTLACSGDPTGLTTNSTLRIIDVNDSFKATSPVDTTIGVSEQLLSILSTIVPENVFKSMYNVELLSVITFAMVMGAIAGRNFFNKTRRVNYLYVVLLQLRNTFFLAIEWVIWATPIAIVFIIAGAFASNEDALNKLSDVYIYPLATLFAVFMQIFVVVPIVYFIFTRCNPYMHMQYMVRAYVFAFCSASSLATAPITLGCIQRARVCSQSLTNFVISVGVVANVTGAGWYFPIGVVFVAESSGHGDELTTGRIVALYFLSLVACFGTPPIPSGGIAMLSTIYQTVFSTTNLPSTWALYVAMDVLIDRFVTVCNVNDDIMALKVIAENTDETVAGDHLGYRD